MRSLKRFTAVGGGLAATAALMVAVPAGQAAPAPNLRVVARAAVHGGPVIVVLRNQYTGLKPRAAARARTSAVAVNQQPIVDSVRRSGGTAVQRLVDVNAVAAHVSGAEVSKLSNNPAVAQIVPDVTLHLLSQQSGATPVTPGPISQQICPTDPSQPLLEPEALSLTHTQSQDPTATQEASSIATGVGVKVAFVSASTAADNPDFVRPDGSKVIVDSPNFGGAGPSTDLGGDEGFGDASSIAAQGNVTYDLANELPYSGLKPGCTFKIRGIAPGASLVDLNIDAGNVGFAESTIIRAFDYAVNVDKVNVLSESFGSNQVPDSSLDPLKLANDRAIAAGVTVVASAGDSGVSGTVGIPATDPNAISAAATTSYKDDAAAFGYTGWTDNNIASFSSGGTEPSGGLVDLAAPGDGGMAVCTPDPVHDSGCSSVTEAFGGTSESAPFIAAAAADVIQAYSDSHGGVRPSPALIKEILTGTAVDTGAAADQQGSGLLDVYAAVRAAQQEPGGSAAAAGTGAALLPFPTQLDVTGNGGTSSSQTVNLTNTGSSPLTVTGSFRTFGAPRAVGPTVTEQIGNQPVPAQIPPQGAQAAPTFNFTVPQGLNRLTGDMIVPAAPGLNPTISLILVDPNGKLTQESYDYGQPNIQHVVVSDPVPGTWTAKILWFNGRDHLQEPPIQPGAYKGPVSVRFTGENYVSTPATAAPVTIPANSTAPVNVNVPLPAAAGDAPESIQFSSGTGGPVTSVPVSRRTLLPADGGSFTTHIISSVGRGLGQVNGYYLNVPAGKHNLDVTLTPSDLGPQARFIYLLVNPNGQVVASDASPSSTTQGTGAGTPNRSATLTVANPVAGPWELVTELTGAVSGTQFDETIAGTVAYDKYSATAYGLPTAASTTLARRQATRVNVVVTNAGPVGRTFFLDPRLPAATVSLPLQTGTQAPFAFGDVLIPRHTTSLTLTSTSNINSDLDLQFLPSGLSSLPDSGFEPEVDSAFGPAGTTSSVTQFSGDELSPGNWQFVSTAVGPFGNAPAPSVTASYADTAISRPCDPTVVSPTGDRECAGFTTGSPPQGTPVYIGAGVTATIPLTITPKGHAGTVHTGTLYVDENIGDFDPTIQGAYGSDQEVAALPYAYTVGRATVAKTGPATAGEGAPARLRRGSHRAR